MGSISHGQPSQAVMGILGWDTLLTVAVVFLACRWLPWLFDCLWGLIKDFCSAHSAVPAVEVPADPEDLGRGDPAGGKKFDYKRDWGSDLSVVPCWDPSTLQCLGELRADSEASVAEKIARAREAQKTWASAPFSQRRQLLRTMQRCILRHTDEIAEVSCRDSGKTAVDALVGEITVTLEKLRWTAAYGEQYLRPEYRDSGLMNMHKTSRVEWVPVGVVGAIIPWNYPFHNVFNPLIAALFSGNAIVLKASEFASWSTRYYGRLIRACLQAVGAPVDLVQFVLGYAEVGRALVQRADKVIFVGSVDVGKKVMAAAAETLTPVILELGGKDPFVVCDDADPAALAQLVVRGALQNMGQNCAGPERFIVYDRVYDEFCRQVAGLVKRLRQGPPMSSPLVDCGACAHPPSLERYQELVDDAVSKGAKVLVGGGRNAEFPDGQFYLPTVLADVTENMKVAQEETFGPIIPIFRVRGATPAESDAEAVRLANACRFALSSCAHSADDGRAAALCGRFEAGMASVNDVEGTTYLSQSLPFGGYKDSGFGRFAGREGLRGLCHERSIVRNRAAFLRPSIPRPIAYPANGRGPAFCKSLNLLLYGAPLDRIRGLAGLVASLLAA